MMRIGVISTAPSEKMNFGQDRCRNLLSQKLDAFAYQQVIPDESGNHVDYIFFVELRVQLIAMQPRELEEHLKNRTTMAHSIRRGLVLMDEQKAGAAGAGKSRPGACSRCPG